MSTITKQLSNAIARKHFLHDCDDHEDGSRTCFFSQRPYDESGWGFWVRDGGEIDIDDASSNGETPSQRIVAACRRAAIKYLARR